MINYQTITIDLQPDYREPVVQMYLSERDVGRPIQVNVLMQGQPYSFTAGTTVHIDLRKPSGHVVQVNGNYAVGSNVVLFNVVEQMAAEPGMCLTELSIVGDGQDPIGSKNWLTKVELSPMHAGDPSETWIEDLDELVQDAMEGHIDATLSIPGDAADAAAVGEELADLKSALDATIIIDSVNLIPPDYENGFITSTGTYSSPDHSCRSAHFIDISGITNISYMVGNSYSAIRIAFFDDTQTFISRPTISTSTPTVAVPTGAKYIKMCFDQCDAATALTKNFGLNAGTDRAPYEPYNLATWLKDSVIINGVHRHSGIKWCAMGDSITQGTYSDDQGAHLSPEITWAAITAELACYDLTNKGIGGTGWVKKGSQGDKKNAREQVGDIDFSAYDLVTLSFGLNDWKGGVSWGTMDDSPDLGGTVYSNMKYVLQKIITDNPYAKVVVITPFNCRQGKGELATEVTNYAIGYDYDGHTLQDMYDLEVEVCEYYGIQYIDMTHTSIINRLNAVSATPDAVHPSLDAHRCIAYQTANSLMYNS